MIRDFKEYLEDGTVEQRTPDLSRSKSLAKEAITSMQALQQIIRATSINDINSNMLIKHAYDIIMAIIRSRMLEKGYSASGRGAHEAEVAYLRLLGANKKDMDFLDQLRYFRNGIMYYGKKFNADYAKKAVKFAEDYLKELHPN